MLRIHEAYALTVDGNRLRAQKRNIKNYSKTTIKAQRTIPKTMNTHIE